MKLEKAVDEIEAFALKKSMEIGKFCIERGLQALVKITIKRMVPATGDSPKEYQLEEYRNAKKLVEAGQICWADIENLRKQKKINKGQAIQLYKLFRKLWLTKR